MVNFSDSGNPTFRASSAFERGEKKKERRSTKRSIHFNGSEEHIELLLPTIISANRLSVYRATADLLKKTIRRFRKLRET